MIDAMMRPDMVYLYPLWAVALCMLGAAVAAALILDLLVGRCVGARLRRRHNVLTASVVSVVGVTYAVLLAFVAMLAWEGYGAAQAATSREATRLVEAAQAAAGLDEPGRSALRADLVAYGEAVRGVEWPAQAAGHLSHAGDQPLDRADAVVAALRPDGIGQGNVQAAAMAALTRLRDARGERIAAAETGIPGIVWSVVIVGGAITLASASLLGTWNRRLHVGLAVMMSVSGMLILVMIVALSHPFRGDLGVTSEPLADSLVRMRAG